MRTTLQWVYDNHNDYIEKIIRYYVSDWNTHKDVKQELYLAIDKVLSTIEIKKNPSAFIHTICKWHIFDSYDRKKAKKRRFIINTDNENYNSRYSHSLNDFDLDKDHTKKVVKELLKELSKRETQVVDLFYFKGMSINDISNEMNIKVASCREVKFRAVSKMRGIVKQKKYNSIR